MFIHIYIYIYIGQVRIELTWFRGNRLSNTAGSGGTACLTLLV